MSPTSSHRRPAETPLERILRIQAEDDGSGPQTVREWTREHGGTTIEHRWTLRALSERVASGEDFFFALAEFLDDLYFVLTDEERTALLRERPVDLDDPRLDAFLGAVAEHFSAVYGLERPPWATEPGRFLERYWFVAREPGFRPQAVVESPAAFRRRGILIVESLLSRI
jgi:hypothetical protein